MKKYGVLYVNKLDDLCEQKGIWIYCDSFFHVKDAFYINPLHSECKIIEVICEDSHLEIYKNKVLIHTTTHKSTFDKLLRLYKNKKISVTIKERGNDEIEQERNQCKRKTKK